MNKNNNSIDLYKKILLIVCTAITVVLTVIGYKKGIFTDETQMELFLNSCGIFAPLFFVFIQAVQVIIPILPGAVGCVYGVMFWGPLKGFIFNYIGICIGSIGAFLIARQFGQRLVIQMTGEKFYDKYSKYHTGKQI